MEKLPVGSLTWVTFCILLQSFFVWQTAATCSKEYGPSGHVQCAEFYPDYERQQWATCLTDSYIRQKSKGKHFCVDRSATYCLYQCMKEIYNFDNVDHRYFDYSPLPVYPDCACVNNVLPNTQGLIPKWCHSTPGHQCNWYSDCLKIRHRCEGTAGGYVIKFAETFCNLYKDNNPRFSQIGQNWIDAVRKCLQVGIVPILRRWVNITCDGIRQMAFWSHKDCYLSPYPGQPSVCSILLSDFWKIFWTIKSAFIDAFEATLNGLLKVRSVCARGGLNNLVDMIKLEFSILREHFKRSTSEALDDLAGAVADAMGSKLRWIDAGVMWYAYSNSATSNDTFPVHVLITGNGTYNLNNIQGTNVNLTAVKERVMKAVQDGDLSFSNIGKGSEPIYVKQMKECIDFACLNTTNEVNAPEKVMTTNSALEQMGHCQHCQRITYCLLVIIIIVALQ